MAYKFHTEAFLEKGVDFQAIFADKQKKGGEQLNLSFNLPEIVDFIKKQSENFTRQDQHLMDLDAAVKKIVEQYEKITEAPKHKDAASIQPKPNYEVGIKKPLKSITTPKKVGEEVVATPVTPIEEPLEEVVSVAPVSPVVEESVVENVVVSDSGAGELTKEDYIEKIQAFEGLLELDPEDADVQAQLNLFKDLYEMEFGESYGAASSSSEKTWQQELAEGNDKQLADAGFDVSKLTAEQKDAILEPSNAPENYSHDGESSAEESEAWWTRKLKRSGLSKEDIARAKSMQLGYKMKQGGSVESDAKAAESAAGQEFAKGGETSSLKVENYDDLEAVTKYMFNAVKKHSWDLKDLVHYFEVDNNFDYKVRSKIWADMNMYEAKKTHENIYKLLAAIVEGNGRQLTGTPKKMEHGGDVVTNFAIPQMGQVAGYEKGGDVEDKLLLGIGTVINIPNFGFDKNVRMTLKEVVPLTQGDIDAGLGKRSYKFSASKGRTQYYPEAILKKILDENKLEIIKQMENGGDVVQFSRPQIGAEQTIRLVD